MTYLSVVLGLISALAAGYVGVAVYDHRVLLDGKK